MAKRNDENEETELWREYRRAQQQRRADRLGPRSDEILALTRKGFGVHEITAFQFRVDGVLDFYPIHRRFHHIKTGRRGSYTNPLSTAIQLLRGGRS